MISILQYTLLCLVIVPVDGFFRLTAFSHHRNILLSSSSGSSDPPTNLLDTAFSSLSDADRYDSVLISLCGKILDTTLPLDSDSDTVKISDSNSNALLPSAPSSPPPPTPKGVLIVAQPLQLLDEMIAKSIEPSANSICALIDVSASTYSPTAAAAILSSLSKASKLVNFYGNQLPSIVPLPSNTITRSKLLASAIAEGDSIPEDNRAEEVGSAVTFSAVLGFCFVSNFLGPIFNRDYSDGLPSLVIWLLLGGVFLDNFYTGLTEITKWVDKVSERSGGGG